MIQYKSRRKNSLAPHRPINSNVMGWGVRSPALHNFDGVWYLHLNYGRWPRPEAMFISHAEAQDYIRIGNALYGQCPQWNPRAQYCLKLMWYLTRS